MSEEAGYKEVTRSDGEGEREGRGGIRRMRRDGWEREMAKGKIHRHKDGDSVGSKIRVVDDKFVKQNEVHRK